MDIGNVTGRDGLVRIFAEYKIVPKKIPMASTGYSKSDYILERRGDKKPGGNKHAVGPKTRKTLIKQLGIDSDEDCERVREEIKDHPRWGRKA